MKKKTDSMKLVKRALSLPARRRNGPQVTVPECWLAIAWLNGEVEMSQVRHAIGPKHNMTSGNQPYAFLLARLKEAYRLGMLKKAN